MDLREARFHKRLSQYDIALRAGIPQSRVSLAERGYTSFNDKEKKKIAEIVGVPVGELFPEEEGKG